MDTGARQSACARLSRGALAPNEVRVVLLCPPELRDGDRLLRWLAPDEAAALARLRFEADRRAYAAAHAARRLMVASALRARPGELVFGAGQSGRPVLASHPHAPLHFSHSRSRLAVACAVTRLAPVGIDVEPVEPARADLELLQPFVDGPVHDFFAAWTALEAFWKCQGRGLADGNPRVRFEPQASGHCTVVSGTGAPLGQTLRLQAPRACAAAVALAAPAALARLRVFQCASVASLERLCGAEPPMKNLAQSAAAA